MAQPEAIDPEAIDLRGRAKEARLVIAYAAQVGASALPFLERAFREGSAAVRTGAAEALARVAPAVGEQLALTALARLRALSKPPKRERAALMQCLIVIGSERALDAVVDIALSPGGPELPLERMARATVDRLLARVTPRLPGLDRIAYRTALNVFGLPSLLAERAPDEHRPLLMAILDDDRGLKEHRDRAARVLLEWRDGASMAALLPRARTGSLPDDVIVPVLLASDPGSAFDLLAPLFREDRTARQRILPWLTAGADARWRALACALLPEDPRVALEALCRLGDLDSVDRAARGEVLDSLTRQALHTLGMRQDVRAAPLLRSWIERPEGQPFLPMLLSALAECGQLDDAHFLEARLEARLPAAGAQAGFYHHAINAIRARRPRDDGAPPG